MNINGRRYLRIIMVRFHAISVRSEMRLETHEAISNIKNDITNYLNCIISIADSVLNCTDKNDEYYDDSEDTRKLLDKIKRNVFAIKTFRLDKLKEWGKPNKNTLILTHISKWSINLCNLIEKFINEQRTALDNTRNE